MKFLHECPICNSSNILRYGKKSLFKKSIQKSLIETENQFLLKQLNKKHCERSIYLCRSCSFLFQNPTYDDDDLKNLYSDGGPNIQDYYELVQKSVLDLWSLPARKNLDERRNRYANAMILHGGTRILDYGGKSGINLVHPSLNHTKRYVYDFGGDTTAESGIRSIKNLDVKKRFDFILHTHVLEHEPDPLMSLRKLRKLVAPDGILYLEVPFEYAERILKRRPGSIWHVNYFNRKTIMEITQRTGWKCQSIKISNIPYNHFFMNGIIAILRPHYDGLHPNRSYNLQVLNDMARSLLMRLVYAVFNG